VRVDAVVERVVVDEVVFEEEASAQRREDERARRAFRHEELDIVGRLELDARRGRGREEHLFHARRGEQTGRGEALVAVLARRRREGERPADELRPEAEGGGGVEGERAIMASRRRREEPR